MQNTVGARKPNVFFIRMVDSVRFVIQTCRKPNKQDGREKIFSLGCFKYKYIFSLSIKQSRITVILFVLISNVRFHISLWRCGSERLKTELVEIRTIKCFDFERRSDLRVRILSRYCIHQGLIYTKAELLYYKPNLT